MHKSTILAPKLNAAYSIKVKSSSFNIGFVSNIDRSVIIEKDKFDRDIIETKSSIKSLLNKLFYKTT